MTDRFVVRAVVVFLGVITLSVVWGGIWLADHGQTLGDALIAMGSGALGGLTGFLVSSRSSGAEPQEVQVVNAPADPVPVDAA